ncbi:MAG: cytochrome c-type biogenesis protein CcmH [Idiomarinaceae bacterium HL-53]|nr:MAG: cytochrome c-type biogenesis protein CcmH [Idiomarinaceae bacterium HL-53]CUS47155.1 cytochrome c-type biogenesis protein CcmH [Idiomarinaceae bacterium HL-53]
MLKIVKSFGLAVLLSFMLAQQASAQGEYYAFETAEQERIFNTLTKELRCPKCQNQSISDSDAPLAADMRQRVYQMVMEGQSRNEIIAFMKVRYGDFVHYQPPLNASTIILWLGPFVVLVVGLIVVVLNARGRRNESESLDAEELTAEEEARIAQLLDNNELPGEKK